MHIPMKSTNHKWIKIDSQTSATRKLLLLLLRRPTAMLWLRINTHTHTYFHWYINLYERRETLIAKQVQRSTNQCKRNVKSHTISSALKRADDFGLEWKQHATIQQLYYNRNIQFNKTKTAIRFKNCQIYILKC